MNTTTKGITAVAMSLTLALCASHSTASADELIKPSPMAKVAERLNPLNWRLPKWKMPTFTPPNFKRLLPMGEKQPTINKKKQDGLFSGVAKTASSGWNRTKQAFDARKLNPINYFPASAKTAQERQAKSKPGFFGSLWKGKETEQAESPTVTEFLRQSRPGF